MLRAAVAGSLAAATLAAAAPPPHAARYVPVFTGGEYQLAQKPKRVVYGAANQLTGLRWTGWDGADARARGRLRSTGAGGDIDARVKVEVDRVRKCQGKRTYTRLTLKRVSGTSIGALGRPVRLYCPS